MEFANKEVAVAFEQRQGEIPAAELSELQLAVVGGGSIVGSAY